jgi:hypothetical protein
VVVYNYARVSDPVITRAAETARRAYLAAGIESRWLVCPQEGCGKDLPAEDKYLQLFVMPRMRTTAEDSIVGHPAGMALIDPLNPQPRGYAFYDAVTEVSNSALRPLEVVLAGVLVHESGHLLGLKHDARGAMRPNLDVSDLDDINRGRAFTPQEEKKLRDAMRPPRTLRAAVPRQP